MANSASTQPSDKEELERFHKEALDLLSLARIAVRNKAPYYMRMVRTLVPVPVPGMGDIPGCGGMAVTNTLLMLYDPKKLVTDPEFGEKDEDGLPQKLAGAIVHEVQHVLRDLTRVNELAKTDPEIANISADIPINEDLRTAGFLLPTWVVYAEKYNLPAGESMEWYFHELMKNREENKNKTEPNVGAGACGSIAGNPSPAEEDATAKAEAEAQAQGNNPGKLGRDKAEIDNAKRSTASEAQKHFENKGQGDTPGWLKEAVDSAKKKRPERNWTRELQHVVRRTTGKVQSGGADFSLARPSKRSLIYGFPRPGLVDQQVNIYMFEDTSASMGQEELTGSRKVIREVLEQMGLDNIMLAQGDTTITMDFTPVNLRKLPKLEATGRGGTDFRPVFERLKRMRPKPDIIFFLTDGGGPAPERPPPGIPVVWVIVPSRWRMKPTTWGHYVICSNDHDVVDEFTDPT